MAAGRSTRSGPQHKLLARDGAGRTMIARTLASVAASRVTTACVVLAPEREDVARAVREAVLPMEKPFTTIVSPDAHLGLSTSLRAGIAWAATQNASGALICLGDMPLVSSEILDALIARFKHGDVDVVLPEWEGQIGNPVLWGACCFDRLGEISGDRGGKMLLADPGLRKATVQADLSVLADFDTPEALERFAIS
nr:nucleotidyltransferase family protein [Acetobacter conturbans]